ncbi:filamentous hemagglutinin [Rhodoferax lacus]|uniref:Filamentous hemagglutinin n=1 Tax=Rhodoferax lacus TaxID=2184758 RepID=A0A3E1R8X6_9BURK|nr:filamentous haemagglutinin family protein [Rhodoferax lacus]RFO95777.1 filamentous hemagglutinin [Rhodoferax lacus]
MNRNCYQLVFNATLGMVVPQAETARRRSKSPGSVTLAGVALASAVLAAPAFAVLPVAGPGGTAPAFVTSGSASYQTAGNVGTISQVGNKSILNWQSFNVGAGNTVKFQQVDSLATKNLVQGASFTSLNRIWDANPSVISGAITQGAGQQANIILVNNNGIAFMNGAQVNLNSFTATSLNMADKYVTSGLLGDNLSPQFEGSTGFIKVMEGAQITAGSQGRVMLLAPTVVNRGSVTAPDGQVILAAGTKAYLRVADNADLNLRGLLIEVDSPTNVGAANTGVTSDVANAAEDRLGHVTNSGTLSTPRGNITMVGYAVNQNGIAKATTSVVSNGSIYLMAKDTMTTVGTTADSSRAGQVVLGAGSVTSVLPDVADATTAVDNIEKGGTGLDQQSEIRVLGNRIYMAGGASVVAPSGKVDFLALDDPSKLTAAGTTFVLPSSTARLDIAAGAVIDVAGLSDVAVSVARNTVEVQLRGDELKDSPINQVGALRGQTVYVDIAQALANAAAGQQTLIAADSLQAYAAKTNRTVAERSTQGGKVKFQSEGEAILENGSVVNLSGGSLAYQGAVVQRSLVGSNGKFVDVTNALATTRYDSLPTRLVVNYGRWNHQDTFSSGPTSRYVNGYAEGNSAGTLSLVSLGAAYLQSDVIGNTTVGANQRASGQAPKGATLTVGSASNASVADYKINQQVLIKEGSSSLPAGFAMDAALTNAQRQTLELNSSLLGTNRIANLEVFTNSSLVSSAALSAPALGEISLVANALTVQKDLSTAGGSITLSARNTTSNPLNDPVLRIADHVALKVGGTWVNDKLSGAGSAALPVLNAGTVSLSAAANADAGTGLFDSRGTLDIGQGVSIDASAGAYMAGTGKISNGKAGEVSLAAYTVTGLPATMQAYGATQGGKLSLSSNAVQIGGTAGNGVLALDADILTRGGFGEYAITGLTTLDVAENTAVLARQTNRQLNTAAAMATRPSGTALADVSQLLVRDDAVRKAVTVSLTARQANAGEGVLTVGRGATLATDVGGKLTLSARNTLDVEGSLVARGGNISLQLDSSTGYGRVASDANALWLGSGAVLDASGVAVTSVDSKGLTQGKVLAGGSVTLNARTGYVAAQEGSRISVAGVAPVRLDVENESGGIGRVVGSDAGSVQVSAEEGMVLASTLQAQGGSASNRNGNLGISLSANARLSTQGAGFDTQARELHLANTVAAQVGAASATQANPLFADAQVTRARIGVDKIAAGGFDTVAISSRDGIVLEGNLNFGGGTALPMRELKLDAARIETNGGNATLAADAVRLGNYDTANRVGTAGSTQNTGTLTARARMLELAGNLRLQGMASTTVAGSELVQLSGITRDKLDGAGVSTATYENSAHLTTTGNLTLQAGVVTPSSYGDVTLQAAGKTIRFEALGAAPTQPLSALGSLKVQAQAIEQAGRIWAPLGQIALNATNQVTLSAGSVTSVAADAGSVLPLGQIQNGLNWVVNVDPSQVPKGQLNLATLPQKSVSMSGASVDMQTGSTVNVAGGGNLQAYEFTVGPGGSRDILADANVYAVVPSFKGGFAPTDPQESFNLRAGTSIYLSGMPGLAAGTYTLLPAHYALLPGAFAVRLDTASSILPGQEYTRQDGVRIASGYLTDSRSGAPRDASWKGFEVLTGAQIHARSELTVSSASDFFAGSNSRPMDAGQLVIATTGTGASSLQLNGSFVTAAASGGRGAAVDISADRLAIVSGATTGIDPTATVLQVDTLNAMGASSLLLGGTRTVVGDTITLQVGASNTTLANGAGNALQAPEVILAATDTVTLKSGSKIVAEGAGTDGGTLTTDGMGALVRVASSATTFVRTGNPGTTQGTLTSEVVGGIGSTLQATKAVTLDATRENGFKGSTSFRKAGQAVAGYLAVGASKVNFGNANGASGVTYSQDDLDALNSLASMAFTSYSTFDLYGDVKVGGTNQANRPTLASITLQGAGLVGRGAGSNTASINAKSVLLSNPGELAFSNGGSAGSGQLAIVSDTLTLGAGSKTLDGFSSVAISSDQVLGQGTGSLNASVPVSINTARLSGASGSDQTLALSGGGITLNALTPTTALAAATGLGARWTLNADSVALNTAVDLQGGQLTALARSGDVSVGANGRVDVSGRSVAFFDQQRAAPAGRVALTSTSGNVLMAAGGLIDVSAAAGGDAGTLQLSAVAGTVQVATGNLLGSNAADAAGVRGEGARVQADVGSLASFSDFNSALGAGYAGQRQLRVRSGDVTVAASDVVRAKSVDISADTGKMNVAGTVDASAAEQGSMALYAGSDLTLASTANLVATSSKVGKAGGTIALGSTSGVLSTAAGSRMDVSAGSGGVGGRVNLRAARTGAGAGTGVNVSALSGSIAGASSVVVEAVKTYSGIDTLLATGGASGSTLDLDSIKADNDSFGANTAAITAALGKTADSSFHVRAGVEVQSGGDLVLGDGTAANDWNLLGLRTNGVEPGTLTLRAAGNLLINSNLSDGFSAATRNGLDGKPALVATGDAWSYRLVAGADNASANTLRTRTNAAGSVTLANDTQIRSGTGSIAMAAARDIVLSNSGSVVYTAGKTDSVAAPVTPLFATSTYAGGDVSLNAGRDVRMAAPTQLYSEWLFRQGRLATNGLSYATQPAWWVRFDLFKQGVATLGGGNVSVAAGRDLLNVSASAASQGHLSTTNPGTAAMVKTGGGNVQLQAERNVMGGQFYADNGAMRVTAGGKVGGAVDAAGLEAAPFVYPVIALGDATARIEAQGDVNILAIFNPTLLPQSTAGSVGSTVANVVGNAAAKTLRRSVFSTYGENTAVALGSVAGDVILHDTIQGGVAANMKDAYGQLRTGENSQGIFDSLLNYLPPSLEMAALQGDVKLHTNPLGGTYTLAPSASGQLDLLAHGNVQLKTSLVMSDRDPNTLANLLRPANTATAMDETSSLNTSLLHAGTPVHANDTQAAHLYAVTGDVSGVSEVTEKTTDASMTDLVTAKALQVRAGRDVLDFNANIQNANASSVSYVQAGRDIVYGAGADRTESDGIKISGAGRLEVTAGRNLDLGTSSGIRSRGNLENANLGSQGADIQIAAGVGAQGIDYSGTVTRLLAKLQSGSVDDATLWQARWLVGDSSLNAAQSSTAVAAIAALPTEVQRLQVRDMVYTALRTTGRDYNSSASGFGGDYARGYAALDLVFPGIATKAADDSFANYQGNVNLFASRIKSESGGNIEFMVPGGDVLVGLANTPAVLVGGRLTNGTKAPLNDVLGIVVASAGDIKGFARNDIVVNQSRILTVGGGDVLLWSSEGGIDAGKGKKTASAVPPPVIKIDAQGNVTQVLQGAATGSGIGALSVAGVTAGDVDLIAPKGTVNAGDAGIRAGNLNVAALDFKGADNVAVSGKSVGTPVADTSAVTAAASGASSMGDDASKNIAAASQNASDAARAAQALATALKPTIVRVDVLGFGE